jgi:hypothetical protein
MRNSSLPSCARATRKARINDRPVPLGPPLQHERADEPGGGEVGAAETARLKARDAQAHLVEAGLRERPAAAIRESSRCHLARVAGRGRGHRRVGRSRRLRRRGRGGRHIASAPGTAPARDRQREPENDRERDGRCPLMAHQVICALPRGTIARMIEWRTRREVEKMTDHAQLI